MATPTVSAGRMIGLGALGLIIVMLSGCYTIEQSFHFLKHQLQAKGVDRAAAQNPEYDAFFREAEAVRAFGREELDLTDTKSYTTFVDINRDYLVTVVSGVRPTSFERKLWRFPIVGSVPYKGFYREGAARRTAQRLSKAGWETYVRRVGAFSSLGYFKDPLYSYMSSYHPERLASMLLHEMTHATVWIPDDAPLNEALATFVGDRGALDYLRSRFGAESPVYQDSLRRQAERTRFVQFMGELAGRLEGVYGSELDDETKSIQKQAIIAEEKRRFAESYNQWFSDDSYRRFLDREINNAYVDLYRTYNTDLDLIASLYSYKGEDLSTLISAFRSVADGESHRALLHDWLAEELPDAPTI